MTRGNVFLSKLPSLITKFTVAYPSLSGLFHRVVAPFVPRVASEQTLHCHDAASKCAVLSESLFCVVRARWPIAAGIPEYR